MRQLAVAFAIWFAFLSAGSAVAAESASNPYDCAVAYYAMGKERGRFQRELLSELGGFRSPVELAENATSLQVYEFDDRAAKLSPKIEVLEEKGGTIGHRGPVDARFDAIAIADEIAAEATLAPSDAELRPAAVYSKSRSIFERVHACDVEYGYTPVIGALPPQDEIVAGLLRRAEAARAAYSAKVDARQAELADLDDMKCAARFLLLSQMNPQDFDFVAVARQKVAIAANKAMDSEPGMTQERVAEMVRRDAEERGGRVQEPGDIYPLLQEINVCEALYGLGLTKVN